LAIGFLGLFLLLHIRLTMRIQFSIPMIGAVVFLQNRSTSSYSTINPAPSKFKKRLGLSTMFPQSDKDQFSLQQRSMGSSQKARGWHRRVWSKILPARKEGIQSKTTLRETKELQEIDSVEGLRYAPEHDEFIVRNFEEELADELFLGGEEAVISLSLNEGIVQEQSGVGDRGSPFVRITRKTFQKILMELLDKWSKGVNSNMIVECDPTSNLLQFCRGQFYCDATINIDRIVFGNIRFSGGQLQARNFCLNLFSFVPLSLPLAPSPRYPNQFDLLAHNLTFTQNDLWESSCIRNGLRRLIKRILKNKGLPTLNISIQSIQVLPTGKLSCQGEATALFGPPILFELRSKIGTAGRGHILTFPGLEIAINPSLGFFVPVIPDVTVDLGHNAQLLEVCIDGNNSQVTVSASVTITPEHTLQLKNFRQPSHSYGALCAVDVGRWLTRIGRFAQ
jgi:hypothetical protein